MMSTEKEMIRQINEMSHEEMCSLWRFGECGHEFFDMKKPNLNKTFRDRFSAFGGMTPGMSKKIGWGNDIRGVMGEL